MTHNDDAGASPTRRTVLRGAGGVAAFSLSGLTAEEARAAGAFDSLQTDPHTRDVYRSIVDALIPRTPELADELGPEHEPGGLGVEAEQYIIWDFDHFQEVRAEALTSASQSRFEAAFTPDAAASLLGESGLDGVTVADALDLGALERFSVEVTSVPEEGPADLSVTVETTNETVHQVMQNYPYAEGLAAVFELVAVEFVARGGNEQPPAPVNEKFPAGGLFVRLAPRDRLRCLESIVEGGTVARLADAIGALVPSAGIVKFAVMGVFGMAALGYYSEWPAYGDTKTAAPSERELQKPPGEVISRKQSGYPGPRPGYAAHRGFELDEFRENDWEADR